MLAGVDQDWLEALVIGHRPHDGGDFHKVWPCADDIEDLEHDLLTNEMGR
jgi:hypothetical protein